MEGSHSKNAVTEILWLSYLAMILILSKTFSHENMGERPTEEITKICREAINYSTHGTIKHVYFNVVGIASFWKEQDLKESVMKIDTPALLMSSLLGQCKIQPTLLLPNKISELASLPNYSATASDSRYRVKRQQITYTQTNGQDNKPITYAGGEIKKFTDINESTVEITKSTDKSSPEITTESTNVNPITTFNETQGGSTDQYQGGWPMWVWIVIAVAVLLVIIAVIISIIVCINMNKTEETPASAAESAESFGSSESAESEEEGARRLHRGRRQIAACTYCPQTLQRYGSDGPSCGRNCCNTESNEQRNISNAL